tara:strand:+ start:408 stop:749 length:342 start_codon:yes stop_codon:yes gene_type:complete
MERPLKKGPVSVRNMKNGEEVIQYHRGRLKLIRKEFGKLFELEFSSPEMKELKTFAKHSDVRTPQKNAIKVIAEGVRVADESDKKLYTTLPDTTDSEASGGEAVVSSGNVIPK